MSSIYAVKASEITIPEFWPNWSGFLPLVKCRLDINVIETQGGFYPRSDIEEDEDFVQIVPIGVLINPSSGKIFCCKRGTTDGYSEERLRGKWAIDMGGHWEDGDRYPTDCLMREFEEEMGLIFPVHYLYPNREGLLYLWTIPVCRVHLGIVFTVIVSQDDISIVNAENDEGGMLSRDGVLDVLKNSESFDEWSEILLPYYSRILGWKPLM